MLQQSNLHNNFSFHEQAAPALALRDVSKRYQRHSAVEAINLVVQRGEVLGFLGPNGAGKTTTIRLITGFLRPTTGSIHMFGQNMSQRIQARRARQHLGYVPDVAGLDPASTGARLLDELAALQRQPALDREQLCATLELSPHDLARPLGTLSRGTRQKINLVQGMQHRPDLLILDEPTEGLDPLGKQALFDLLQAAHARGTTIFFSSHVLSEVEELCDRVALIRGGRLIAVDRISELRRRLQRQVTVDLAAPVPEHFVQQLAALPTITNIVQTDTRWQFAVTELEPLLQLLAALPVRDLHIAPPSLADIFLRYYRADDPHAR